MSGKIYFDSHFHPVFKQFISRFEDYPSTRSVKELMQEMDLKNDLLDFVDENVLHILQGQCSFDQMKAGTVQLGVASIASLEFGIAASQGFLAKVLHSRLTRPLDQRYMQAVSKGEISYYRLFLKELQLYRKLQDAGVVSFLTRKKKQTITDKGCFLVLGMEGGHNLVRTKIGSFIPDATENSPHPSDPLISDFHRNPDAGPAESLQLLQQALWDVDMDLFYLTLTHLTVITGQVLATHAFGLKMLRHPAFYPQGYGITEVGKKVIAAAYGLQVKVNKLPNGKPIKLPPNKKEGATTPGREWENAPVLIDVKHMSLRSRLDLYALREEMGQAKLPPVIASHMGVTGYSIEEWKDALANAALYQEGGVRAVAVQTRRKKAGEWGMVNKEFTFNPWSINLFDEDIAKIMESDGLIGLSLDVRILGFQAAIGTSAKDTAEYLSPEEFKSFFPNHPLAALARTTESVEAAESWLLPTKEDRHPLCLCFNLLHIIAVGLLATDRDPWQHVCIGSDFDGLIDPVKICRSSAQMPELERNLLRWMPIAEAAYREQNGGPLLLDRKEGSVNMAALQSRLRAVLYNNGKAFIERWMGVTSGINPQPENTIATVEIPAGTN